MKNEQSKDTNKNGDKTQNEGNWNNTTQYLKTNFVHALNLDDHQNRPGIHSSKFVIVRRNKRSTEI